MLSHTSLANKAGGISVKPNVKTIKNPLTASLNI